MPGGLFDQLPGTFTALPIYIFATTKEPATTFRANTAAAIVVLLLIVLVFNTAAILLRNRYEKKRMLSRDGPRPDRRRRPSPWTRA